MERNDWYEAGERIVKLVQDAVDSKDFSQLGNTISDVVNDTVNGLQSALKKNISGAFWDSDPETGSDADERTNRAAAEQIRRSIEEKHRRQEAERAKARAVPDDCRERAGRVHGEAEKMVRLRLDRHHGRAADPGSHRDTDGRAWDCFSCDPGAADRREL